MHNETLLIVDADPFDLRSSAAQLRSAGFTVQISSTAEQALLLLRTLQPDLILAATQLPGMSGVEFIERLRANPSWADIAVVAITRPGMAEEGPRAIAAGAHGYLGKPLDKRWLSQIEGYLSPASRGSSGSASVDATVPAELLADPEMENLRRNFLADGIRQCETLLASLGPGFDGSKAGELSAQWAGSAAHLGFGPIAVAAREAATILSAASSGKSNVREALERLARAFQEAQEPAGVALPAKIVENLQGARLALVGFAEKEADRICAAVAGVKAYATVFDASESPDSEAVQSPTAVLLHVRPETASSAWLQPDGLKALRPLLVLVGTRDAVMAVDPGVHLRAQELLIDGWQPEEVLMRLGLAIGRARAAAKGSKVVAVEGRVRSKSLSVLIADDDPDIRALVAAILKNHGFKCTVAKSGEEALAKLAEAEHDAAVLDVNMPGLDGFEVLAKIREGESRMPVLLLTARQQESDVVKGFTLGANDYLVKPFNPMELLARLRRLLS